MARAAWIGLALVAAAAAGITGIAAHALDPATLKPQLIEAARKATGRTLTISGKMGIKLSLVPTIWMEDVSLSNPPGFSRPDMVNVARVELSLDLLPLLRHRLDVDHVVLVRPDVLLEGDPAGPANWMVLPEPTQAAAEPPPAEQTGPVEQVSPGRQASPMPATADVPKRRFTTTLKDVSVEDGQIGWIDPSGHHYQADVRRLSFTEPAVSLTQFSGTIAYQDRTIEVTARTGSPEELRSAFGGAPWPVTVELRSGDATVTVDGKIAHPLEGKGYVFTVDANVPQPAEFAAFLPGFQLASLGSVTAHAEIRDSGGPAPTLTALAVQVASADMGKVLHGARLTNVVLSARGTGPLQISARLALNGAESGIVGNVGDLNWLTNGRSAPVGVDLAWSAASARGTVKGVIRQPRRLAGYTLDVAADVPDPALVLDGAPPALKSVAFQARLTDLAGPMPFQFTSNAGDLEGDLSITRSPRLSVTGTVSSRRLNLDMLRGPPPAGGGAPSGGAAPAAAGPLIPDTTLPLGRIRRTDADIKVALGHMRFGGADFASIDASLSVKDGVLRLDPFSVTGPDERLSAAVVLDANATPPRFHLTADSPGFALRPLLEAFGLPLVATGTVELHADLTGTGETPRALAASVEGRAGVAIEGGVLDADMVNSWLAELRPLHIDAANATDLRCFAVRADAKSGLVTIEPGALNTAALIVEANGDVDLRNETLALRVRPRTKIGGTGIALPVRVSGPLRSPSAKIDISGKGFGAGALAGLLIGGKDVMGAAGGGDPCPAALGRARESAPAGGKP